MIRPGLHIAGAACLGAVAMAVAGCGTAAPARPAAAVVTAPAMPLDTSVTTASGTWVTVSMGGSAAQHNNFWQLFARPSGATRWKLVTPPGTADNGGLVLAAGSGQQLTTAFRPSQYLTYTPLTQTGDGGRTWSALGPLDAPLAATPGSLAVQPGTGRLLALLSSGAAEQGTRGASGWTTLVTARALAATPAGRSCGLSALTAVSYSAAGVPLLAGACTRPGIAGIFAAGQVWRLAGPVLTGALAGQPVTVLRVSATGSQITALLGVGAGRNLGLVAAWSGSAGTGWSVSPLLRTGGHAVTATSLGPGPTVAVITADARAAVLSGEHWRLLPALPPSVAAIVPGADGAVDALAVHRSTLTVWRLASLRGHWTTEQVITVPIQYGSSG